MVDGVYWLVGVGCEGGAVHVGLVGSLSLVWLVDYLIGGRLVVGGLVLGFWTGWWTSWSFLLVGGLAGSLSLSLRRFVGSKLDWVVSGCFLDWLVE